MPITLLDSITSKLTEKFPEMENPKVENAKIYITFNYSDIQCEAEIMTDDLEENWEVGEINTISNSAEETNVEDEVTSPDKLETEIEPVETESIEELPMVKMYTQEEVDALVEEKACGFKKKISELEASLVKPEEVVAEAMIEPVPAAKTQVETETTPDEQKEPETTGDKPDVDTGKLPASQKSLEPQIFGEPPHYGFTL